MLTACIIVKKKEEAQGTIESLKPTGWPILIGEYDPKDYSASKNSLLNRINTEWAIFVEPSEILAASANIKMLGNSYRVQILNNGILTKETRIIRKNSGLTFTNPVFETIRTETVSPLYPITLICKDSDSQDRDKILLEWKRNKPTAPEVIYYESCMLLASKNFEGFLKTANHFIFLSRDKIPVTMTKYYIGLFDLYVNDNIEEAMRSAVSCLAVNPLMAEFWCLLGDAYYKNRDYAKAIFFYENAIFLGSRRKADDEWPLEISKYSEHPNKMIESCQVLIKQQDN